MVWKARRLSSEFWRQRRWPRKSNTPKSINTLGSLGRADHHRSILLSQWRRFRLRGSPIRDQSERTVATTLSKRMKSYGMCRIRPNCLLWKHLSTNLFRSFIENEHSSPSLWQKLQSRVSKAYPISQGSVCRLPLRLRLRRRQRRTRSQSGWTRKWWAWLWWKRTNIQRHQAKDRKSTLTKFSSKRGKN